MQDPRCPLERNAEQRAARRGPEAGHSLVAALFFFRRSGKKDVDKTEKKHARFFRCHGLMLQLPYLGLARGDDVVQAHAQARLKAQGSRRGGHFFLVG